MWNSKADEERTKYMESIKTKFLANQLSGIRAYWHKSWESIAESNIRDWEKPDHQRTVLFLNVKLDTLIEKQDPSGKAIFNYRKMYNPRRYDDRTSSILDAWINKTPILPPVIKLSDGKYLLISDGVHRVNAAMCLNESTIPILVENYEICKYGMERLYELGNLEMVIKKP